MLVARCVFVVPQQCCFKQKGAKQHNIPCAALGADMYDSVYPSRTARFGVALVPSGVLKLKNICYREDFRLA